MFGPEVDDKDVEVLDFSDDYNINETTENIFDSSNYDYNIRATANNDFKKIDDLDDFNYDIESNSSFKFNDGDIKSANNASSKSNSDDIKELNDLRNRLLIHSQEEYSKKEINYEPFFDGYRLSEPGEKDIYVKINTTDKFNIRQINEIDINELEFYDNSQIQSEGQSNGRSLTKSTAIGRAFADNYNFDYKNGFTNILFFIFRAGLSVGVVFMVILNFFIK